MTENHEMRDISVDFSATPSTPPRRRQPSRRDASWIKDEPSETTAAAPASSSQPERLETAPKSPEQDISDTIILPGALQFGRAILRPRPPSPPSAAPPVDIVEDDDAMSVDRLVELADATAQSTETSNASLTFDKARQVLVQFTKVIDDPSFHIEMTSATLKDSLTKSNPYSVVVGLSYAEARNKLFSFGHRENFYIAVDRSTNIFNVRSLNDKQRNARERAKAYRSNYKQRQPIRRGSAAASTASSAPASTSSQP